MTRGNTAEALPDGASAQGDDAIPTTEAEATSASETADLIEYDEDEAAPGRGFARALPWIALLAGAAWLGGMLGLTVPTLRAPVDPVLLVELIAALCVPLVLIGVLYLLAMRNSTAEARRFGRTARAMRAEAAALERTVAVLARKIEENRAALAEQTNLLIALGDSAAERLAAISNGMAQDARTIDGSTRTLVEAASGAEERVNVILNSLPRAHEEMRGLAATVEAAGLSASEKAAALDAQLAALAERGREADHVAGGAAQRLAAHIARMESTSEAAGSRLEQVTSEMSSAVDTVLDRAAQAVDEARKSIAAQGEAMLAMLGANQAALDKASRDSAETLAARIAAIEEMIGRISQRLAQEQARSDQLVSDLSAGIARTDGEIDGLHSRGIQRTQELAASVNALEGSFGAMRETMRQGDETARAVIATAENLLTALDASAREMDETMPAALARLDTRIAESRQVVAASTPELLALVTAAESSHDAIAAIADVVRQQRDTLVKTSDALMATLESGRDKADALEEIIASTNANARRFAEEAAPTMIEALLRVRETAASAAQQSRETLGMIAPEAGKVIEHATETALKRAIDGSVRRQLAELAETTEHAVTAATRASERLTQQMLTIAETTAAVEERIDKARAEQESADRDNFARRVSLLIEALNSASIDISKSFSEEVSDAAWAAYLKGDRGVFTRRAVKLLDAGQAREIANLYDEDAAFREHVNRYIHDFEAMLRHILGLRDGSPMGVTLLSSDMGKLYVALAQAIERLRT